MQHIIALLTWPPGTQAQVLAYDLFSMGFFFVIAAGICLFTTFNLVYLLKCVGAGAAFPTLLLLIIYPVSPDVQRLFSIEVVEYVAMIGAAYAALLSLHTLLKGP